MAKNRYELYQGDCLEVMDKLIKQNVKVDAIILIGGVCCEKENSHYS